MAENVDGGRNVYIVVVSAPLHLKSEYRAPSLEIVASYYYKDVYGRLRLFPASTNARRPIVPCVSDMSWQALAQACREVVSAAE